MWLFLGLLFIFPGFGGTLGESFLSQLFLLFLFFSFFWLFFFFFFFFIFFFLFFFVFFFFFFFFVVGLPEQNFGKFGRYWALDQFVACTVARTSTFFCSKDGPEKWTPKSGKETCLGSPQLFFVSPPSVRLGRDMGGCKTYGGWKTYQRTRSPKNFWTPPKELLVCSVVDFCTGKTEL